MSTKKNGVNVQMITKQLMTDTKPITVQGKLGVQTGTTSVLSKLAAEQNVRVEASDRRQFGYSFAQSKVADGTISAINKQYDTTKGLNLTDDEQILGVKQQ